jgi:hypothetical protein
MDVAAVLLQLLNTLLMRERAERERAELLSQIARLGSRVGRILSEETYQAAQRCVFALSLERDGCAVGVGILC